MPLHEFNQDSTVLIGRPAILRVCARGADGERRGSQDDRK
jgi:hypothetical protein